MTEPDYDEFAEDHYPNMHLVRAWSDCKLWSAGIERLLLVLVDDVNRQIAVFEYDIVARRESDIQQIIHLRDEGGEGGAGVPATIRPDPPGRTGEDAKAIPVDERDGP